MADGEKSGPQGDAGDGIGAAASQAYTEALEGGASPQEAFDAATSAASSYCRLVGDPRCTQCALNTAKTRVLAVFWPIFFGKFWKKSLYFSLIKICNLCTPPYDMAPLMRIPMPNALRAATGTSTAIQNAAAEGVRSNRHLGAPLHRLAQAICLRASEREGWVLYATSVIAKHTKK